MTFEEFYNKPDSKDPIKDSMKKTQLTDPTKKRGPHHLKLSRGLNTDRKNLGIVAKMHQLDPTEHPLVRRLKAQQHGKEFLRSPLDAQKIASKYGINLTSIQQGETKTLGNKTGITIYFDKQSKMFVLSK